MATSVTEEARRVLVADWSAHRMGLTSRDVGPSTWGLLGRIAAMEAFDGTGIASRAAPIITGIHRFFPEFTRQDFTPGGFWSFMEGAPETVGLRLRRRQRPAAFGAWEPLGGRRSLFGPAAHGPAARRRATRFGTVTAHGVPEGYDTHDLLEPVPGDPPVAPQRLVDESIRWEGLPTAEDDVTPMPGDGTTRGRDPAAVRFPTRGPGRELLTALKLRSRTGGTPGPTGTWPPPLVAQPPGTEPVSLTTLYDPAALAAWEDRLDAPDGVTRSRVTGAGTDRPALALPWDPGRGAGIRIGMGRTVTSGPQDPSGTGRTTAPIIAASSFPAEPLSTVTIDPRVPLPREAPIVAIPGARATEPDATATSPEARPTRPGATFLTPLLEPGGTGHGDMALPAAMVGSDTILSSQVLSRQVLAPLGPHLARMMAGASITGHGAFATPSDESWSEPGGLPRLAPPYPFEPGPGSLLAFHPSSDEDRLAGARPPDTALPGEGPSRQSLFDTGSPAALPAILPERVARRTTPATTGTGTVADQGLSSEPSGLLTARVTSRRLRPGTPQAAWVRTHPPREDALPVLAATGMAGPSRLAAATGPRRPAVPVYPVQSLQWRPEQGSTEDTTWTTADLAQAPFLPTTLRDMPVRSTVGIDLRDERTLLRLGHAARETAPPSTYTALPGTARESPFVESPAAPDLAAQSWAAPFVPPGAGEAWAGPLAGQTGAFRTVLGTEDLSLDLPLLERAPGREPAKAADPVITVGSAADTEVRDATWPGTLPARAPTAAQALSTIAWRQREFGTTLLSLARAPGQAPSRWRTATPPLWRGPWDAPAATTPGTGPDWPGSLPARAPTAAQALSTIAWRQREFGTTLLSLARAPGQAPSRWRTATPPLWRGPWDAPAATTPGTGPDWPGRRPGFEAPVWRLLGLTGRVGPVESGMEGAAHLMGRRTPSPDRRRADLENLSIVRRTLARAMGALPAGFLEPGGESGPQAAIPEQEVLTFLQAAGRSRVGPVIQGTPKGTALSEQGRTGPAGAEQRTRARDIPGAEWQVGAPGKDGHEPVRPTRSESVPPGIPEGATVVEFSLPRTGASSRAGGAHSPAVGGGGPVLSGLVVPGVPVPAYGGLLPLVSPALSAVRGQAMMSRREEGGQPRPPTGPEAARESPAAGSGGKRIDMDALAMEMAERIMKRMRRDKERRGLYG